MTWSIVARDHETGFLGAAAATRFFAVGACVPFVASRGGAIATQGLVNPHYGIDGLRLLGEGHRPTDVLATLTRRDPGRAHRQAHMVDPVGLAQLTPEHLACPGAATSAMRAYRWPATYWSGNACCRIRSKRTAAIRILHS